MGEGRQAPPDACLWPQMGSVAEGALLAGRPEELFAPAPPKGVRNMPEQEPASQGRPLSGAPLMETDRPFRWPWDFSGEGAATALRFLRMK